MDDNEVEEAPFRAEYAKSSRSVCKSCKNKIEKDILRLAVMVQSPVYDGKMPNWYHFDCFFIRQRPKNVGEIAHFDSLRWDDQQKIKEKLDESPEAVMQALKSGDKKPTKRAINQALQVLLKDFVVEYAKSSRAMCRGCEIKLSKGELRISKKDYESQGAKMYGGQDKWHHVDCFAKLRDELGYFESGEILPGYSSLKIEDKEIIKKALPKIEGKNDTVDGPSQEKKMKKEEEQSCDEEELKSQNEMMFKIRDSLSSLAKNHLSELLMYNNQEDAPGVERKLDRLADIMTFGALSPCEQCKTGQLVYRTGLGYQCNGHLNEWTKCPNTEREPKRIKFKVPKELAEQYPFLDSYKCKIGTRLIPTKRNVTSTDSTDAASTSAKIDRFAPFRGMSFIMIGISKKTSTDLRKQIISWGGEVVSKVTPDVTVVVSTEANVEKNTGNMKLVEQYDIPVVPESYVSSCSSGNPVDKIYDMVISPWGLTQKKNVEEKIKKSQAHSKSLSTKSRYEKSMKSSKVTVKVRGGLEVDPESNLQDSTHVYVKENDVYSIVLGYTDVKANKNSYYKMQILISDVGKSVWMFKSWGRIGTKIGGKKVDRMKDLQSAKGDFYATYFDKTGNDFKERKNFVKKPNLMYPIDIDYGQDEVKLSLESKVDSKLSKAVQDLVQMLFDVDVMKKVMMEFELDLEKMPLGKLSKKQIKEAYAVLSELQKSDGDIKPLKVVEATNKFYTLIPHDFGVRTPPLLDNKEIIQTKLEMLESLLEMELAYSLLKETKEKDDETVHPIDMHYTKLNTEIEVLDRDSEEFKFIRRYVRNTHAQTHSSYTLDITEVFKAKRTGEEKRYKPFKKLHNRKLLWHGSRTTNFAGILSQGLRIAPPEAPVTGYMFGKGIYFADMVSKSANYCMTSSINPEGLLLLCEVALGDMYERTKADYIEKLPVGKHSTKGLGKTTPDPKESIVTPEGVEIPLGKGISSTANNTTLLYNEYIVYDVAQVKVQYLVRAKFNYIH